jgi:protein involved in temperature-dependent protein secretion
MTLENLLAIHRLVRHEAAPESIRRLLAAAARNLADARLEALSSESRFDCAYKAIRQAAMAALWFQGYRTPTSELGHHQTAIQALPKTLGVDAETVVVLDALRKKRNLSDYEGEPIGEAVVTTCIAEAEALLQRVAVVLGERGWHLS